MLNFSTNQAQSQGQDLRFSKADGTHLQYEIENWDSAGKAASAWVLVDTVFQSSATQYIKMYWGKSDAVAKTNSNAVFDTANNFAGVWHLSNSVFSDATYNNATTTNSNTTDTVGVIGTARKFIGANRDYMQANGLMGSPAVVTLSAWVKLDSVDGVNLGAVPISIGDCAALNITRAVNGSRDSMSCFYHYNNEWNVSVEPGGANHILHNGWKYLTYVCNPGGSSVITYLNGVSVKTSVFTQAIYYTGAGSNTLFGRHGNGGTGSDFGGVLDEPRIEKTARNADWIKLCYNTQMPSATVIGVDSTTEMFLPLTVSTFGASQGDSLDSCIIATKKWTLKFDRFTAGGIKWLSPDSMGTATNQLDTNLFYLITNNNRSDTGLGMLKLQDK